jgi:hypothetical protein
VAGPILQEVLVAGDPAPWRDLGFALDGEAARVGGVVLRAGAAGKGMVGWSLGGVERGDVDGLPVIAPGPVPSEEPHPNGALGIDHVVVSTPDLVHTVGAFEAAGLRLRREREAGSEEQPLRQAFFRAGEAIVEVVGRPDAAREGPARFWGLVFNVADLDACAERLGDRLGRVRDAVQPGRRIAPVRREAGLPLAVALMTPEPEAG